MESEPPIQTAPEGLFGQVKSLAVNTVGAVEKKLTGNVTAIGESFQTRAGSTYERVKGMVSGAASALTGSTAEQPQVQGGRRRSRRKGRKSIKKRSNKRVRFSLRRRKSRKSPKSRKIRKSKSKRR